MSAWFCSRSLSHAYAHSLSFSLSLALFLFLVVYRETYLISRLLHVFTIARLHILSFCSSTIRNSNSKYWFRFRPSRVEPCRRSFARNARNEIFRFIYKFVSLFIRWGSHRLRNFLYPKHRQFNRLPRVCEANLSSLLFRANEPARSIGSRKNFSFSFCTWFLLESVIKITSPNGHLAVFNDSSTRGDPKRCTFVSANPK